MFHAWKSVRKVKECDVTIHLIDFSMLVVLLNLVCVSNPRLINVEVTACRVCMGIYEGLSCISLNCRSPKDFQKPQRGH